MKKLFLAMILMAIGTCVFAQKKHLVMYYASGAYYLEGDIPSGLKSEYSQWDLEVKPSHSMYGTTSAMTAKMLDILSAEGYSIDHILTSDADNRNYNFTGNAAYILSKPSSSSNATKTEVIKADDEEVTEVARYNLQGMQVGKNEKGIQVIVYSNYTTKTVIVE